MITLQGLTIQQGRFSLANVELTIPTGEYGILMGPTGSGKTTLLEAICGLRRILGGKIFLDQVDVTHLTASARRIGYVPQDAVLFPSMRIDHQIGFGLEVRKYSKRARTERVEQLAEMFAITSLLRRTPPGLSGGEKQRVALARALAFQPRLLCLDEPLAALDDETRIRMAEFLRAAHQKEGTTVLHITHRTSDAANLGTIQFRLENGKIHQT